MEIIVYAEEIYWLLINVHVWKPSALPSSSLSCVTVSVLTVVKHWHLHIWPFHPLGTYFVFSPLILLLTFEFLSFPCSMLCRFAISLLSFRSHLLLDFCDRYKLVWLYHSLEISKERQKCWEEWNLAFFYGCIQCVRSQE